MTRVPSLRRTSGGKRRGKQSYSHYYCLAGKRTKAIGQLRDYMWTVRVRDSETSQRRNTHQAFCKNGVRRKTPMRTQSWKQIPILAIGHDDDSLNASEFVLKNSSSARQSACVNPRSIVFRVRYLETSYHPLAHLLTFLSCYDTLPFFAIRHVCNAHKVRIQEQSCEGYAGRVHTNSLILKSCLQASLFTRHNRCSPHHCTMAAFSCGTTVWAS